MIRTVAVCLASGLCAAASEPACLACHTMRPRAQALRVGPHARVSVCGDCHESHQGAVVRAWRSSSDGVRHLYRQVVGVGAAIRLQREGGEVIQANCVRCHPGDASRVPAGPEPRPKPMPPTSAHAESGRACIDCHSETSHAVKPPERNQP